MKNDRQKTALEKHGQMIQQIFITEPWKIFIGCIMLNQTTGTQVHKVIYKFFEKYPTPDSVIKGKVSSIENMIRPLGLYKRRAKTIKRFSHDFLHKEWVRPSECYGIGKYAEDSWDIFVMKRYDTKPNDKELKAYLEYIKNENN